MFTASLQKGKTPLHKKKDCPGYDTKLYLMVRLLFWRSGKCGAPLHCYCQLGPEMVVRDRVK